MQCAAWAVPEWWVDGDPRVTGARMMFGRRSIEEGAFGPVAETGPPIVADGLPCGAYRPQQSLRRQFLLASQRAASSLDGVRMDKWAP